MHEEDLEVPSAPSGRVRPRLQRPRHTLTFAPLDALRAANTVLVLRPSDLTAYRFRDKVKDTPKSARVAHHDSKTKKLISYDVDSDGKVVAKSSADTLKLNTRAESPA